MILRSLAIIISVQMIVVHKPVHADGPWGLIKGEQRQKTLDRDIETVVDQCVRDNVPCKFPKTVSWQKHNRCGLNSVYLMIRLMGGHVSYPDLERAAGSMPPDGLSLSQMVSLAKEFGLDCEVVYGPPESIAELSPPAVIHLGDPEKSGHYVCYYHKQLNPRAYRFVDGTSGALFDVSAESPSTLSSFGRDASGYAMIPRRRSVGIAVLWSTAAVIWAAVALVFGELGIKLLIQVLRRKGIV